MIDASCRVMVMLALCAAGCNAPPEVSRPGDSSPSRKDRLMAPEIECSAKPSGDGRVIVCSTAIDAGNHAGTSRGWAEGR